MPYVESNGFDGFISGPALKPVAAESAAGLFIMSKSFDCGLSGYYGIGLLEAAKPS
jgi:hypothetical protein